MLCFNVLAQETGIAIDNVNEQTTSIGSTSSTLNQTPLNAPLDTTTSAGTNNDTVTEQRWYQVELIIAERLKADDNDQGIYAEKLNQPNTFVLQGDVVLDEYLLTDNEPYVALPADRRLLNDSAKRLQNSPKYNVLFHQAWPQAFIKNNATPWIDISSASTVLDQPKLAGSINVQLKRFLHVTTQLVLRDLVPIDQFSAADSLAALLAEEAQLLGLDQAPSANDPIAPLTNLDDELNSFTDQQEELHIYTMNQTRKMRSRKLHYLDHPRLALLIRIDPYDPETGLIVPEE